MIDRNEHHGEFREHEKLEKYTSWRTGGAARYFYQPADLPDLQNFLQNLPVSSDPVFFLGLGSNVLIRDGGFPGTVISTRNVLKEMSLENNAQLQVQAGLPCALLARFASKNQLTGMEFYAGIPGTIGGALAMNAGAYGCETWDFVSSITLINRDGSLERRAPESFRTGYRQVEGYDKNRQWFANACLQLQTDRRSEGAKRIKTLLQQRSKSQPTNKPTAGSVFRNPPGDYAARLIESCGLKNCCEGGACVSDKHANFIINNGTATSANIERLILRIQDQVKTKTGRVLQAEVRFIGVHQEVVCQK